MPRDITRSSERWAGGVAAAIGGLLIAALGAMTVFAQPAAPPARSPLVPTGPITISPIRGGANMVTGPISNSGFVVGKGGGFVIDTQISAEADRTIQAEISRLSGGPVGAIILTHSDPDHINGLTAFPRGVDIYAHANVRRDIERVVQDPTSNGLPPSPEIREYVPNHPVDDRMEAVLNGVPVVLLHVAPAHTDGDLIIYLPRQKVVFAGDVLTPSVGPYPGIHLSKHGSWAGWIKTVKVLLTLDADTFVPGHGTVQTRGEVVARLAAAEMRVAQIKSMVAQHKTLDEIKASFNDPPITGIAARFPTFTETTYAELMASAAPEKH